MGLLKTKSSFIKFKVYYMSMILLVASKKDPAGMNIAEECERIGLKVFFVEEDIIYVKTLPDANAYIFLSRHKSESGKPSLTAHFPGNFGTDNTHGGNSKELSIAFPSLEKIYFKNLVKNSKNLKDFQIVLEATHHGPTQFDKPILFVEIGSSEKEWKLKGPAEIIAQSIKETLNEIKMATNLKIGIAFGGTHYPEKFTKLILEEDYALGHIFPKYQKDNLTEEIMDQMANKSIEPINYCIIDDKGINNKSKIIQWAEKIGLKIIKI